jgi:hypothetical protein
MRSRPFPVWFQTASFFLIAAISAASYLVVSRLGGFLGFALDDAWIHQTYARNLALVGQFAFVPGQASAGSTSPLWTLLLAVGYFVHAPYLAWAYVLGTALLGLTGWLTYRLVLAALPERAGVAWLAGALVSAEWHLVWAAVSGMETLLFAVLVLAAFVTPARRAGWLGVWVGVSILARPDGLTLLPFIVARLMLAAWHSRSRLVSDLLRFTAGFLAVFLPYLAFNAALAGSIWPNTFYAKQAEYAVLRQWPLWQRLWLVTLQPFVGAQALLLPGLGVIVWKGWQTRRGEILLPLMWVGAFLAAYVLRLPATYQHGRYLMPVIPVLVGLGVGGTAHWLRLQAAASTGLSWPRLVSRAWLLAFALVSAAFWGLGAKAYQSDVQIIESEMVQTAHWINQNTPPEALIAAHDIGALGYFGQRKILDMAGLISPDVIPLMGNDARLKAWLLASHAKYLIIAPGWGYPDLVRSLTVTRVYSTNAPYSPAAGGENMVVYQMETSP